MATVRTGRGRRGPIVRSVVAAFTIAVGGCIGMTAHATDAAPPVAEVELTAQASALEANDEMRVRLLAERAGPDVSVLNEQVLRLIRSGLDAAVGVSGVKARAGSVTTEPQWDGNGKREGWRVVATLLLEGNDLAATGQLAGRLARDLQLAGVEYRLSAQRRAQAENRLIEEAAKAFRERARLAAAALGFDDYTLGRITIQTGQTGTPPIQAMRMAAEAAAVAVPAEGGEATVEVSLTGTVRLR